MTSIFCLCSDSLHGLYYLAAYVLKNLIWFELNKILLNKSNYILFHSKKKQIKEI